MTTLPPPDTDFYPEDSLEKKVYTIVEKFKENIPIMNDRNRLGYNLFKFMNGEGDAPVILVKSAKIKIEGITKEELASKINGELSSLNK